MLRCRWPGQIACPLLSLDEVLAVYQPLDLEKLPMSLPKARRGLQHASERCRRTTLRLPAPSSEVISDVGLRSGLFAAGNWAQLLSCPRLVDPVYATWRPSKLPRLQQEGLTTEDGMRLKGHRRTPCRFGGVALLTFKSLGAIGKCYDQKKGHRAQQLLKIQLLSPKRRYSHPGDVDWQRLPCRYAARGCRDRSQGGP